MQYIVETGDARDGDQEYLGPFPCYDSAMGYVEDSMPDQWRILSLYLPENSR